MRVADDEDERDFRPEISNIGKLNIETVSNGDTDDFNKSLESVRMNSGISPSLKRKLTNELKKFNRSVDKDVESRQIDEKQYLTGYDAFGVIEPPHNLDTFVQLYEISGAHYAAVNAKVANIVGLGYKFVETPLAKRKLDGLTNQDALKRSRRRVDLARDEIEELFDSFNEEDSFIETLKKVWIDYEATGNGYFEINRRLDGTIGYIGHVPSKTIRVRRDRDGFVQISAEKAQFFANYGAGAVDDEGNIPVVNNPIGTDRPSELLHIKKHSPASSYYGIPDILAAQLAVAGDQFASKFNIDFFENKATPRHIIVLKGSTLSSSAQRELLQFFETGLKGQNHRSIFVPLPGDSGGEKVELEVKPVEAGIQDASFSKYKQMTLDEVLMVHRVPITKVLTSSGTNLAVARDADKTFKEQVCGPEQKILEKKINRLVKEITNTFLFKLNEMTLSDEETQSKIDERRIKTGVDTPNEQRAQRGLPGLPGGDKALDINAKGTSGNNSLATEARANRERDSRRSAGATDSAGEGRNPKGEGRSSE